MRRCAGSSVAASARGLVFFALFWLGAAAPSGATTIVIDGVNDFTPADTHATSTPGYTGYATQDGVQLYLGFDGANLFAAPATTWMVAYLGTGAPGSTQGLTFNTQQPGLAFSASHALRWRLDGAFLPEVQAWNGASWQTAPAVGSAVASSGGYVEAAINLGDLGNPGTLLVAAYLLNEQTFNEWSYAALPGTAFVDDYDPQVGAYLTFAVPEPSTALLVGAGLGLAAAARRGGRARRSEAARPH